MAGLGAAGPTRADVDLFGQQRLKVRGSLSAKVGDVTAIATVNVNGKYKNQYLAS